MLVDIARIRLLASALEKEADTRETVAEVFERSGLTRQEIEPPAKLYSARAEALFVRNSCDVLNDVLFGARTGLQFKTTSSLTAYISKYSRDLEEVINYTAHFHRLIDPALAFNLRQAGNSVSLEASWKDPSYSRYHRRTEFLMFACLARTRELTGTKLFPIEIRFQHRAGARESEYSKIGNFPVLFGAEKLEIIFPISVLNTPVPTYDPSLRQHLLEYGERLLQETSASKQTLRALVEGLISDALPGPLPRADAVARELGMSARTFARRLTAEDTSFREIVDDLRSDLAQTFMKGGMRLSEVSFALGYADQAAFSTAFKRWTGQAPTAFRGRVTRSMGA